MIIQLDKPLISVQTMLSINIICFIVKFVRKYFQTKFKENIFNDKNSRNLLFITKSIYDKTHMSIKKVL